MNYVALSRPKTSPTPARTRPDGGPLMTRWDLFPAIFQMKPLTYNEPMTTVSSLRI